LNAVTHLVLGVLFRCEITANYPCKQGN
jgi:hypothetical protein